MDRKIIMELTDKFELDRLLIEQESTLDQLERVKIDMAYMIKENNRTIKLLEFELMDIGSYIEKFNLQNNIS